MYKYQEQLPKLFTLEGVKAMNKTRDEIKRLLSMAGAFRYWELSKRLGLCDDWLLMTILDFLVESKELKIITQSEVASQYVIYIGTGNLAN